MLIQVLGAGCTKCNNLAVAVESAAKQLGVDYTVEKVTDINKIVGMGVMTTPAIVVDGKLKCTGVVPSVEQIMKMLQE